MKLLKFASVTSEEILPSSIFSEEVFALCKFRYCPSGRAHREIHLRDYSSPTFWIILGQTSSIVDRCLNSPLHSPNINGHPSANRSLNQYKLLVLKSPCLHFFTKKKLPWCDTIFVSITVLFSAIVINILRY